MHLKVVERIAVPQFDIVFAAIIAAIFRSLQSRRPSTVRSTYPFD
jgi:hypothetical protein